jgi:hypothetical protein
MLGLGQPEPRTVGNRVLVGFAIFGIILSGAIYILSFTPLSWSGDIVRRHLGNLLWRYSSVSPYWITITLILVSFSLIMLGSQLLLLACLTRWALARGPGGRRVALSWHGLSLAGARVYRTNLMRFVPRRVRWLIAVLWLFGVAHSGVGYFTDSKGEIQDAQRPESTVSRDERIRLRVRRVDRIVGAGGLLMYGTALVACLYVDPKRHLLYQE